MAIDKRKIIRGRDPNNKKTIRIEKQIEEFLEKEEYLSEYYEEVEPLEYYRDMFPEHSFEMPYDLTCRPNGILNVIDDEDQRGRCYARMIFDDLGMEKLTDDIPGYNCVGEECVLKLTKIRDDKYYFDEVQDWIK